MFGRVSTVPISDFFLAYPATFGSFPSSGIYLGKKFTNQYTGGGNVPFYPKIDGWVNVDSTGTRSYPDYSFPENLPEWFITKSASYDNTAGIINAKRYIIETDGCVGPFTLHEALYIFSTVKELKSDESDQSISVSGADLNLSVSLGSTPFTFSPTFQPDIDNPQHLFASEAKGRIALATFDSDEQDDMDDKGVGSYLGFFVDLFIGGSYGSYGETRVSIIADVDNLSDYYIADFTGDLASGVYASQIFAYAVKGIEEPPVPPSTTPTTKTSSVQVYKSVFFSVAKFKSEFNGTALINVGDSASKTTTNDGTLTMTTEVKYIGGTCNFTFGPISKELPVYGLSREETTTDSGGAPVPTITITGDQPSKAADIKTVEFWPYKNANGQPVYNETTGAIVNPPIP